MSLLVLPYICTPLSEVDRRVTPQRDQILFSRTYKARLVSKNVLCKCDYLNGAFLVTQTVKICLQCRTPRCNPWVRKTSWRREWLPTPVLLRRKFHGQRNLVVYIPWGCKESDTTKPLSSSSSFTLRIFREGDCPRLSRRALNAIKNLRGRQKAASYIKRGKGDVRRGKKQILPSSIWRAYNRTTAGLQPSEADCWLLASGTEREHISIKSPNLWYLVAAALRN